MSASNFDNFPPTAIPMVLQSANGGGVGIGVSPRAGFRLEVGGPAIWSPGGSGGELFIHTPNTETGLTIQGTATARADLRFDGSTLKLVAGPGPGAPPAENGVAITSAGAVGIGTTNPIAKLHVESSLPNTAAVYGNATGAGGVGVYARHTTGFALHAEGSASQSADKGGFVKAMAFVDPFLPAAQYVVRSFNSQPGAAITVTRQGVGLYTVDFGFNVEGRFFSLTPQVAPGIPPLVPTGFTAAVVTGVSGNQVTVEFQGDAQFYIIAY
jgi:hypothetical protein